MSTFTKYPLSESANGRGILIDTISSPGVLIHTGVAGESNFDEVWIYAMNHNTGVATGHCVIQYGDIVSGACINNQLAKSDSLALMVPGFLIQNGMSIRAYAEPSGQVSIFGYINRIS